MRKVDTTKRLSSKIMLLNSRFGNQLPQVDSTEGVIPFEASLLASQAAFN